MKDWLLVSLLALNICCLWFFTGPYYAHALSMVDLINQERSVPLIEDPTLMARAQSRAEFLCFMPFSHDYWAAWLSDLGYMRYGENLAKGFPDDLSAHRALMNSPTHKENIVDSRYVYVGIGHACGVTTELFGGQ